MTDQADQPQGPYTLTPEQATAKLAEARRLFTSLTEMAASATDRLDNVLAGKAEPQQFEITRRVHPLSTRDLQSGVEDLRERGIDDDVIREIMSDRVASKAEYDEVKEFQRKRMGDAEWVKRLLAAKRYASSRLCRRSSARRLRK